MLNHVIKILHTSIDKRKNPAQCAGFLTVGRTGFEPATPWSQTMYSTELNYLPSCHAKA